MGKFSQEDIELAKKVESTYGVPYEVTLGQYALESGWGKSTVGKNNYFNIKGNGTGGYADYDSKEESFMAYGKLLSSERYTSNTSSATTTKEYVQAVKDSGYAEDEKYVEKVMSVIESSGLVATVGSATVTGEAQKVLGLDWWGDIVKVVFAIILVVLGVLFIGLAVTNNSVLDVVKNPEKAIKKAVS